LGAVGAAVAVVGVVPGASEHVITGATLLAFGVGWAMLGFLSTRMTSTPQRWAYPLAAFLGISGLALVSFAPADGGLTAAAWVWPPVLLVLLGRSVRSMRTSTPGRSRWLLYPVLGVLALASVGALVQNVASLRERSAMAMPGRLYDVGGHRLHLNCTGAGSPTVVLENGGAGPGRSAGKHPHDPPTRRRGRSRRGGGLSPRLRPGPSPENPRQQAPGRGLRQRDGGRHGRLVGGATAARCPVRQR
jgi:hypothetical protein